jgi:hypothetical protein
MWYIAHQLSIHSSAMNICEQINELLYLRVYKPHFLFWQELTLQNWNVAYTRNIMSLWWLSPRRWYCMLWNSQWRLLVFETVILQAIAYMWMCQCITYQCIGMTPSIPRSWKTVTSLTNYPKCCQQQPKCCEYNCKYFTFTQVKSSAAYIRVIVSKFLT